jgi:SAM-dependent methyltransferase
MTDDALHYVGNELELFSGAQRWKAYFSRSIAPWIRGDVLEVGAGIGANTRLLANERVKSWLCLEPDAALAEKLRAAVADLPRTSVSVGTTATLEPALFDTLLYIDVLEHIEDDRGELLRALGFLRAGGSLVVLCPAHQALYSEFDRAIGHFRRYDKTSLAACAPPGAEQRELYYLDSVGMLASLANRALLKQKQPTTQQILTWDRFMVPVSTVLDRALGRRLGKSVIGVWTKSGD